MDNGRYNPNCGCARALEVDGETVYECTDPNSPCYNDLCYTEVCLAEEQDEAVSKNECIFNNYNGICDNDDSYNHGDYCPGHCSFYERK